jgi:hypothetical protein
VSVFVAAGIILLAVALQWMSSLVSLFCLSGVMSQYCTVHFANQLTDFWVTLYGRSSNANSECTKPDDGEKAKTCSKHLMCSIPIQKVVLMETDPNGENKMLDSQNIKQEHL